MLDSTSISSSNIAPIRAYARQLVREWNLLNGRFGPSKLTSTRCHALIEIGQQGVLTVAGLAERLNLDKSTTSRAISALQKEGMVTIVPSTHDQRKKLIKLTAIGEAEVQAIHCYADEEVGSALALLSSEAQETVLAGLQLYAKALERSRLQKEYTFRSIAPHDNDAMAQIISQVMTEFGAVGPGFSIEDQEVTSMYEAYQDPRAAYFVVEKEGKVVGGGGIAQLAGASAEVCELRKMYFLPSTRGLGLGKKMLKLCLDTARGFGYQICYLETIGSMAQARKLYEAFGFEKRCEPRGQTGHYGCDDFMEMALGENKSQNIN